MTYLQEVIADAPVHYWRLADGQSYILHDIGSSPRHLVANTPDTAGGYSGIAPQSGSMVGVELGGTIVDTLPTTPTMSLELWCYTLSSRGGTEAALAVHGQAIVNGSYQLFILAAGQAFFRAALLGVQDIVVLTKDRWHHLVGTYDGLNVRLYVDGVNVASGISAGGIGLASELTLGYIVPANEQYDGFLSEVAEYNYSLSAARVLAHYSAAGPLVDPVSAFVSSWSFVGGFGEMLGDALAAILASVRKTY